MDSRTPRQRIIDLSICATLLHKSIIDLSLCATLLNYHAADPSAGLELSHTAQILNDGSWTPRSLMSSLLVKKIALSFSWSTSGA